MPAKGKPFAKGADPRRNTSGRPKRKGFDMLVADAEQELGMEHGDACRIAVVRLIQAIRDKGEPWAIRDFLDRMYGKAQQIIEATITASEFRDDTEDDTEDDPASQGDSAGG